MAVRLSGPMAVLAIALTLVIASTGVWGRVRGPDVVDNYNATVRINMDAPKSGRWAEVRDRSLAGLASLEAFNNDCGTECRKLNSYMIRHGYTLMLARAYYELGEHGKALALLTAPENDGLEPELLEIRGLVHLAMGDIDKGAKIVLDLFDFSANGAQVPLLVLAQIGQTSAALTQHLNARPNSPALLTLRGLLRGEEGDLKGAQEDFSASIRLDPGQHSAYRHRAKLLQEQGEFALAAADYAKAGAQIPDRADYATSGVAQRMRFMEGLARLDAPGQESAGEALLESVALSGDGTDTHSAMPTLAAVSLAEHLQLRGDLNRSATMFRKAIRYDGESQRARLEVKDQCRLGLIKIYLAKGERYRAELEFGDMRDPQLRARAGELLRPAARSP